MMRHLLLLAPGRKAGLFGSLFLAGLGLFAGPARAGDISVAWDPVSDPDLFGYRVFVGTAPDSGDQAILEVGKVTSITLTGLQDCVDFYVSVKAVDQGGNESVSFSNNVFGMTQPRVTALTSTQGQGGGQVPNSVLLTQGEESVVVTVDGASFSPSMQRTDLEFDEPEVRVLRLDYLSCSQVEVELSVGPFLSQPGDPGYNGAGGTVEAVDPALVGLHAATVYNPDGAGNRIIGAMGSLLDVDLEPARTDIDGSGRVDGWDLATLSRSFSADRDDSATAYDPSVDFNGDKKVDGQDLSVFGNFFASTF